LGIGVVPYSPLGRGFLAGVKPDQLGDGDFRKVIFFLPFLDETHVNFSLITG